MYTGEVKSRALLYSVSRQDCKVQDGTVNSIVGGLTRRAITVIMRRSDVKLQRQQHAILSTQRPGISQKLGRRLAYAGTRMHTLPNEPLTHSPSSRPGKGARDGAFFGIVPGCSQQVFDIVQNSFDFQLRQVSSH